MIVTSVVPPELPMELSLAVNNSLLALMKLGIFCTEPFRIPVAGAIDVCCFDKTGTLTADEFLVKGIAGLDPPSVGAAAPGPDGGGGPKKPVMITAATAPDTTKWVLAACHALVPLMDSNTLVHQSVAFCIVFFFNLCQGGLVLSHGSC
jgi:cation-transporting ATPase 13A1